MHLDPLPPMRAAVVPCLCDAVLLPVLQVPGRDCYSLAMYYALLQPLEQWPLLHRFVHDTDDFRNSRFKLIPNIAQVSRDPHV